MKNEWVSVLERPPALFETGVIYSNALKLSINIQVVRYPDPICYENKLFWHYTRSDGIKFFALIIDSDFWMPNERTFLDWSS